MVKVRGYTDNDYEDLRQNLQDAGLNNINWDSREILQKKIEAAPDSILVAEDDGKVVGNVYLVEDPWNSFIFRLSVREDYRDKGIGTLLMQEAEARLKSKGVSRVSVLVRDSELERLTGFYGDHGYIPMHPNHKVFTKSLES